MNISANKLLYVYRVTPPALYAELEYLQLAREGRVQHYSVHEFIKRDFLEASEVGASRGRLLQDQVRHLRSSQDPEGGHRAPPHRCSWAPRGLVAKEGTDVTFQVGGETFSSHRFLAAPPSFFF